MAIRVALNHRTEYRYDRTVSLSPHLVRLRPAPHCRTPIVSYSLTVQPKPHFLNWQQDPYSNYLARLVFPEPARELSVEVDLVAELTIVNPFDFFIEQTAERYPFSYDAVLAKELTPYLETEPAGRRLRALIEDVRRVDAGTVEFLVEVNRRLHEQIRYVIRMQPGIQTCEETLTLASGSCRDSAWLLVQLFRHLGLAARFVSGYLIQLTADVPALDGPAGPAQDFTDLHAWAEVYLPGAGWVGLDPTSGLLAGEGHIPLACTASPVTAAPITGSYTWNGAAADPADKCHEEFSFHMAVSRIFEDPRVTKPYSEDQWHEIDQLGRRIDDDLRAADVRLTMGGEPTFVSIDDRDGAEWNIAAQGPTKRQRAGDLIKRLRHRFAPRALLHYGQGKWYPGESLPRWALGCYWRTDGVPVWRNPSLVADESMPGPYGTDEARQFIESLADRLGVDRTMRLPAYEDAWHYLRAEHRLPEDVDPLQSHLDDAEERRRLARIFERGLGAIVGYALPLERRRFSPARWVTGRWSFRSQHMLLIPGDSPIGYRLPLDSLPWIGPEDHEPFMDEDPFAPRQELPTPPVQRHIPLDPLTRSPAARERSGSLSEQSVSRPSVSSDLSHSASSSYAGLIRTALCVEPRDGRLYVFMPPQRHLEDYLDLVAAIEDTAEQLRMPVLVEGYAPPHDHRMNYLKVTPDPGVIEVNTQPAHDWNELVQITTTLYDEARQARLGTEKFMMDGRHSGTGGGNHIVIGGPTPADSPVLRRPDLLRSLLAYWHNHPSLSYLFSGLFIGPTSQSPRVDEARNDALYELEIAFASIPDGDGTSPGSGGERSPAHPFWLVDRVFRHLLVDVSGNTHRAEFCIDKLYSPDTSAGRLGLVELRAFEMPPHPRMSLVQQLLLRALIARFWRQPYRHSLARWGTSLHDRFMLPHFVEQDFREVLWEMDQAGWPLKPEWFAPHLEFRFPFIGSIAQRNIELELRQAIEPWHVLGEEPGLGGTVRYVDSSVERLQVKVRGATDTRHIVTCNGRRLPMHPTGTEGEFVAGVRFRAWQPPTCLHPTIPPHAPLVFDLVDTWMNRSIGGCTYHVSHPGGRNYEKLPVNAFEAESRRAARFFRFGHTPSTVPNAPAEHNPHFPLTLDLRRQADHLLL